MFQSRPDIRPVKREAHLLELVRYVVLNPVRAGMVHFPGEYVWSNYRPTAGLRVAPSWLETTWTLRQFHPDDQLAREKYRKFVGLARGANYNPWEAFRLEELREIADAVEAEFGQSSESRGALLFLAVRELRVSAAAVGKWMGIRGSTPSELRRSAERRYESDPLFRARIDGIRRNGV